MNASFERPSTSVHGNRILYAATGAALLLSACTGKSLPESALVTEQVPTIESVATPAAIEVMSPVDIENLLSSLLARNTTDNPFGYDEVTFDDQIDAEEEIMLAGILKVVHNRTGNNITMPVPASADSIIREGFKLTDGTNTNATVAIPSIGITFHGYLERSGEYIIGSKITGDQTATVTLDDILGGN